MQDSFLSLQFSVPELLAPAGSLEKLKTAVRYGANAVYLGGQKYGLRSAADNFTNDELIEGVAYAHRYEVKVYVVLNSFFHDEDFEGVLEFVRFLKKINVDAIIVSDLGVVHAIAGHLPIHLSTQASCVNSSSGLFWKEQGVARLILGRETSIYEASLIKKKTGLEVELFIHGSMCSAYSGHCTISNFTAGRDSNRGGCAHSCRFDYKLDIQGEHKNSFFMSSKDLEGIELIPDFFDHQIDSVKVEGRMKSGLYVATVSKVYAQAIKYYAENRMMDPQLLQYWQDELTKFSHRDYTQASLLDPASSDSIFNEREHTGETINYKVIGQVLEVKEKDYLLVEVKNAFYPGDELEVIGYEGRSIEMIVGEITDVRNNNVLKTRPSSLVKIPYAYGVQEHNFIRQRVSL